MSPQSQAAAGRARSILGAPGLDSWIVDRKARHLYMSWNRRSRGGAGGRRAKRFERGGHDEHITPSLKQRGAVTQILRVHLLRPARRRPKGRVTSKRAHFVAVSGALYHIRRKIAWAVCERMRCSVFECYAPDAGLRFMVAKASSLPGGSQTQGYDLDIGARDCHDERVTRCSPRISDCERRTSSASASVASAKAWQTLRPNAHDNDRPDGADVACIVHPSPASGRNARPRTVALRRHPGGTQRLARRAIPPCRRDW